MEEAKAAAYYDELTRKGEGAARFKQGLGFSSSTTTIDSNDVVPARGSALPSSSSFLSNFVRASSPSNTSQFQKQSQLQTIHNKLNNPNSSKPSSENHSSRSRVSHDRTRDGHKSDVERESRERHSRRRRSRSRSRDGLGSRHSYRDRDEDRYRERDREGRRRRRSSSPRGGRRLEREKGASKVVDYSRLIEGYDKMLPAERVKAKMKFQLSETAEKDATKGMGSGWERFEFNKDAPLDDEEIEAAEDDEVLVKHIGQSFRFSAVEAKREEEIKAAHDEAMFGGSSIRPPVNTDDEVEEDNDKKVSSEVAAVTGLVSDKVLGMQRGSWRDRARKL